MAALATFVLKHKLLVGIFWLVITLIAAPLAGRTADRLGFDFSLPGQPGHETNLQILNEYGSTSANPYLVVVTDNQKNPLDQQQVDAYFTQVSEAVRGVRLIGKAQTAESQTGKRDVFSSNDGSTQFAYAFAPPSEGFDGSSVSRSLDEAIKTVPAPSGTTASLTGYSALMGSESQETEAGSEAGPGGQAGGEAGAPPVEAAGEEGPDVLQETLLGGLGALAVLLFVFASLLALLPLLIAAVAILTTFMIVLGLTYFTDISFIVQFLISLVGLGIAIDYSLLIVTRWREERDHGKNNDQAVVGAMRTAGHAVLFSGLTVAISLLALVVLPVPFLRSIGFAGLLIPLVSVAVCLTLLPALLGKLGPRVDWPKIRHENKASKFWTAWGKATVRHRLIAAVAGVALLVLFMVPLAKVQIGNPEAEALATRGPAVTALDRLEEGGIPSGVLTPIEVLAQSNAVGEVSQLASQTAGLATSFVDNGSVRGDKAVVLAIPEQETTSPATSGPVRELYDATKANPGVIGVAGIGADQQDFARAVYGNFPIAFAIICIVTFILLARAFRSLILPIKAILLNVVSLGATLGLVTAFWQWGWGSEAVFDIPATGAITFWIPIMAFAFLFGLSMDYEVFILARMREEYDATHSTTLAVANGMGRTGRLVTSAALILFFAFVALSTAPVTEVKVMATALGFGILLDATVVRMLLVPALVSLMGKYNWWLPDGLARVLRVEPSRVRH